MLPPTYDSTYRPFFFLIELQELFRYRELLWLLIKRALTTRYKRSLLGVLWTLLNPLLLMAMVVFVFAEIFQSSLERYPIYLLTGLVFWQFFSQTTVQAMHALVWGSSWLKHKYLPKSIFVMSAIGSGLVQLLISQVVLVLLMLVWQQPFYLTWWFFPIATCLLTLFTLGVSLFLAALAIQFTDIIEMYQLALQILFWFTPIIYPKLIVPLPYRQFFNLNPLFHLLELFRTPLYYGWLPGPNTLIAATGLTLLTLLLGWWFYMTQAEQLAYRL